MSVSRHAALSDAGIGGNDARGSSSTVRPMLLQQRRVQKRAGALRVRGAGRAARDGVWEERGARA